MSGSTFAGRSEGLAKQPSNTAQNAVFTAGMAWLDLMLGFQREMQRASLDVLSSYSPISGARITGRMLQQHNGLQVIPVGEERLNVATRTIAGETTRLRRRVVAQPVEQHVTLREEKVIVERRPPSGSNPKPDVLTETVIEMSDSRQVPTVWKSLHVVGEVVLRKQVIERTEKVRETVRRDVVDVEHARETVSAPAYEVESSAEMHEAQAEHRAQTPPVGKGQHDEARADKPQIDELQDKKMGPAPFAPPPQPSGRKN
jgi:stress response protein YsnF